VRENGDPDAAGGPAARRGGEEGGTAEERGTVGGTAHAPPPHRVHPSLIRKNKTGQLTKKARWMTTGMTPQVPEAHLYMYGEVTQEDLEDAWVKRIRERDALNALLKDPGVDPATKASESAEYHYRWGKANFQCRRCWLMPYMCVCERMARHVPAERADGHPLPRVVCLMHENEWGKSSNTGTVLRGTLGDGRCQLLLRGLPEHEGALRDLWAEHGEGSTVAVLWPGEGSVSHRELMDRAERETGGRVTLVVLDATWKQARGINGRDVPACIPRVTLPMEQHGVVTSLLAPIRAYHGKDRHEDRVSTAEAVAFALRLLGEPRDNLRAIEHHLRVKVDANLIQKRHDPVYGTMERPFERKREHPGSRRINGMVERSNRNRGLASDSDDGGAPSDGDEE